MHPATEAILQYFSYDHLRPDLAEVSEPFSKLAHNIAETLEGPEATVALRKLLEAKDCAVRAALPNRLEKSYQEAKDGNYQEHPLDRD